MKKLLLVMLSLVSLCTLAGCATRRQAIDLQTQVEAIRSDQMQVRAENARLDSLFRANLELSRKLNADFSSYISRLDERMQMIEARLEDAITLINRAAGAMESRSGQGRSSQQTDTSRADTSKTTAGLDCQKIYNSAYGDMVQERYDLAVNGFKSYIQECPSTALADNAQYWIGECYLSEKQYDKAQNAFETMIEKYPASERIAAGKLKLGKALYEQRQRKSARSYFEDVAKNYPGTDEAQEAAKMLERYR